MMSMHVITFLTCSVLLKKINGVETSKRNYSVPFHYFNDYNNGRHFARAMTDIALGLPTGHVTLLFDSFKDKHFPELIIKSLNDAGITTTVYIIHNKENQEKFCEYTKESLMNYVDSTVIILASRDVSIDLFWMIQQRDLIHRKLLYIFYWGRQSIESGFTTDHIEAMRIALITNPRSGTVYYSQGEASGNNELTLVNWWSIESGLFRKPVLISAQKAYQNFKGRIFEVPVLHKPPWNFVEYANDSFKVDGGRDDKLLTVIADKLNFRYRYIDPPERIQGSTMTENGTFPGVLGQVWQRNFDFFMGDVTITYERSRAVEFSFFTLVDSEAFVTHRPSKLNEAFALIRPFQWQVWPPILITIVLYGPILFFIIEAPSLWKKKKRTRQDRQKLLRNCIWFSTSTFLRQGGTEPVKSHKIRLVVIITTLGATYVIGDMYSANLTSLLARPGREKPITLLEELEEAMNTRGYELLVEKHGSSFRTLQNGTGIHKRLWDKMQTQSRSVIESVEEGMKLVRENKNIALLGGRETLYFDSKRFGSQYFQISEKLNTRYSAIAMQLGCPYVENFNRIIMQLFEGGILTKMTEEEYEKLGEKQRAAAGLGETDEQIAEAQEELQKRGESTDTTTELDKAEGEKGGILGFDNEHQLQPLNTRMLQGAFYILAIGHFLSGLVLVLEKNVNNILKIYNKKCYRCQALFKGCNCSRWRRFFLRCYIKMIADPLKEILQAVDDNGSMLLKIRRLWKYLKTGNLQWHIAAVLKLIARTITYAAE